MRLHGRLHPVQVRPDRAQGRQPATGWGIGYLANVVGQKRAREIWMLTQQYTAEQARDLGLVNSVVPHDQLEAEVERYCNLIKNNSPVILQLQKLTFNEIGEYTMDHRSPAEQFIPDYNTSEEAEERRLAFLERRPIDPRRTSPMPRGPRETGPTRLPYPLSLDGRGLG